MKISIEKYHNTVYRMLEYLDFGQIKEQVTVEDDHEFQTQNHFCAETFQTSLYMSNSGSRNSSFARKGVWFLVKILRGQTSEPGTLGLLLATDHKFQTALLTTRYH
jgi:hypothetical protein